MANVLKKLEISDLLEISALMNNFDTSLKYVNYNITNNKRLLLVKKGKFYFTVKHKKIKNIYSKEKKFMIDLILDVMIQLPNSNYGINYGIKHFAFGTQVNIFSLNNYDNDYESKWYLIIKNLY